MKIIIFILVIILLILIIYFNYKIEQFTVSNESIEHLAYITNLLANNNITLSEENNNIKFSLGNNNLYLNNDGSVNFDDKFNFDSNGNLVNDKFIYKPDGTISFDNKFNYDPSGNLIGDKFIYKPDGTINIDNKFSYDPSGNLTGNKLSYKSDGTININNNFIYDTIGNLTGDKLIYKPDGTINIDNKFTYDPLGTLTGNKLIYKPDGNINFDNKFNYDPSGNLTGSKFNYKPDGTINLDNKFTYDTLGNLTGSKFNYKPDGTINIDNNFTYDPSGNLFNQKIYYKTNGDISVDNYEYTASLNILKRKNNNAYFDAKGYTYLNATPLIDPVTNQITKIYYDTYDALGNVVYKANWINEITIIKYKADVDIYGPLTFKAFYIYNTNGSPLIQSSTITVKTTNMVDSLGNAAGEQIKTDGSKFYLISNSTNPDGWIKGTTTGDNIINIKFLNPNALLQFYIWYEADGTNGTIINSTTINSMAHTHVLFKKYYESSVDIVKDINLNKYLTANLTKPTINTSNAFYLVNKSAYTA